MKKPLLNSFLILVLFVFVLFADADASQIYVEHTHGTGILQSDLDTTTSLVQSAVSQIGHQVADQPAGADAILKPELFKLGKAYILKISEYKSGDFVFSSNLKAASIEELDKVALRVTEAVFKGRVASEDPSVGEITNQEEKEGTQRRPVRHLTFVGLGAAVFSNLGPTNIGYNLGLGKAWDANQLMIKLMANLSGSASSAILDATLGLDYFISRHDLSTYIGGAFGYGVAKSTGGFSDSTARGGFILSPEIGVQIMRTSAVSLDLGLRAEFLLNTNEFGSPAGYALRLAIYY